MARIKIEDLPDSIELDRDAMGAIYGGSSSPLLRDLSRRSKRAKTDTLLFFSERGRARLRGKS